MTTKVHNPKAEFLMRVCDELPAEPSIVEIGCARTFKEDPTDGWSTVYFLGYSGHLDVVDIDPSAIAIAEDLIQKHHPSGAIGNDCRRPSMHISDGQEFLESRDGGPINLLYLDGSNDAEETLRQVGAALSGMAKDSIIVIDDVQPIGENYFGKGQLAIPFLIQKGWKCLIEPTLWRGENCWAMAKLWR